MNLSNTVWIVDDDPIARLLIRKTLERVDGLDTKELNTGEEALQEVGKVVRDSLPSPRIILLDLNMPVMDGWEFLDAYEKRGAPLRETKIVILTSSINPADNEKSKSYMSVSALIHKPLTVDDVVEIMNGKT
ncbi:MAG TPA: response regulator [Cryomorphaceae bacterium]|nr:response regulator [Cryomorphaceae bacterium]